jgi:formiminotetrahydrofolate cyclodeaminase
MVNYNTLPVSSYLDDLAGEKDAPGGGSACGLAGALASALGSMVCHFTVGRKKYAEVEGEIKDLLEHFEKFRGELTGLMQEDVDVFQSEMGTAYSLPKETDDQKQRRKEAIEAACKACIQPPLKIARNCFYVLELLLELAEIGNTQLVSDVGVGAALAYGAFEGAKLNVEINLRFISDRTFAGEIRVELESMVMKTGALKGRIMEIVEEKLSK